MQNLIKIPKPNIGKYNLNKLVELLESADVAFAVQNINQPQYLYFDKITPPKNIIKEELWALVKLQRKFTSQPILPLNFNDRHFSLNPILAHQQLIIKLANLNLPKANLAQEIAYSAAIENNLVKPLAAKKFLQESAPAKTVAEVLLKDAQKIYANILCQEKLQINLPQNISEEQRYVKAPHKPDMLCYISPKLEVLQKELPRFLDFANNNADNIHPVTKAIILHFWFLILNPMPQNNGIYARAISYWFLQKHNINLSCSKFIANDLAGYSNAISYAAQDDNDFTYFLDFILTQMNLAASEAQNSKQQEKDFAKNTLPILQQKHKLNLRQAKLVFYLAQSKTNRINFSSYMQENQISRKTAADDLKGLENLGLLTPQKLGKNIFYTASGNNLFS